MPTQVRIFTLPKSIGETLSSAPSTPAPRSVPINGHVPNGIPQPKQAPSRMGVNENRSYPGVTFAQQDKLPKLPIPELTGTCDKYLAALKPLQSPREHSDTKQAVQEFLSNEGPELQEKLKRYAEGRTSYIEQFCKAFLWSMGGVAVTDKHRVRLLPELRQPSRAQFESLLLTGR